MSWSDRFRDIALGILTGGLYTAAHAAGEVAGAALNSGSTVSTGTGRSIVPPTPSRPDPGGGAAPCGGTEPAGSGAGRSVGPCCCDRFRFQEGFLVDGSTGHVWRYSERSRTFEEVPLKPVDSRKALMEALLEEQLQAMQQEYAKEVLGTLPASVRARQLKTFEKQYVQPLRTAAVSARP